MTNYLSYMFIFTMKSDVSISPTCLNETKLSTIILQDVETTVSVILFCTFSNAYKDVLK